MQFLSGYHINAYRIFGGCGAHWRREMTCANVRRILSSWGKHRRRRLVTAAVVTVAVSGLVAVPAAAAQAAGTAAAGVPGAATGSCPWVTSTAPISQRVAQLMRQMSLSNAISMEEGQGSPNPYVLCTTALPPLCS